MMTYTINEEFLKALLSTPRATGYEFSAQRLIKDYLQSEANLDQLYGDRVGNLIAVINPESPTKVMLAGHIDQIGFQISYIDKNGFLWFLPLGGFDPSTLPGKRVKVWGRDGAIPGVIGRKPIHIIKPEERKKSPDIEKIFIDIGCHDKEEAESKVEIGDFAVFDHGYQRLGDHNYAASAGFDDAIGAFVTMEIMKELSSDKQFFAGVYGVSSVQEEIGMRGATVAARSIRPEVGIAFDVGHAADAPEIKKKLVGDTKLGQGPIISVGPNINPNLFQKIVKLAEDLHIPYQRKAAHRGTGTDANALQLVGAATALVSIPNRYMHTASEVVSLDDVENCVNLVVNLIRSISKDETFVPI
ncbi:MAG: M42 family metallopeptidase [Candidatus Heimdallarchaeota archaeon]